MLKKTASFTMDKTNDKIYIYFKSVQLSNALLIGCCNPVYYSGIARGTWDSLAIWEGYSYDLIPSSGYHCAVM